MNVDQHVAALREVAEKMRADLLPVDPDAQVKLKIDTDRASPKYANLVICKAGGDEPFFWDATMSGAIAQADAWIEQKVAQARAINATFGL